MKPEGAVLDAAARAELTVEPCARSVVDWMVRAHYLGKWPGVCVLVLVLRKGSTAMGACIFALPPRETSVRYGAPTWELAKLWVSDEMPTNTETFFIARAVRYIKQTHKEVGVLVSYADPSAHHAGVIYKAANWTPDGRTDEGRKTPRFDYGDARTGKRYSRRSHVPVDAVVQRIPRVSKARFYLRLRRRVVS